jgi:hypothetical protein
MLFQYAWQFFLLSRFLEDLHRRLGMAPPSALISVGSGIVPTVQPFSSLKNALMSYQDFPESPAPSSNIVNLSSEEQADIIRTLELIDDGCNRIDITSISNDTKRAIDYVRSPYAGRARTQFHIETITAHIVDELSDRSFFHVPPERVNYYHKPSLFGGDVGKRFSKSLEDIENAGNCFALGQPTACVFHLMRAMESAVERLAVRLDVKIAPRDTWGLMLGKMDEKIKLLPDKKSSDKHRKAKWSEARANFYHVKEAWRNESMHPKQTYTMDQAREVIEAVRVFMTGLAKL